MIKVCIENTGINPVLVRTMANGFVDVDQGIPPKGHLELAIAPDQQLVLLELRCSSTVDDNV